MVFGAIVDKGEKYYTDLKRVFEAIDNKQLEYNWLITDADCNTDNPRANDLFEKDYCWISGEELTEIVTSNGIQWIWAVLSAFDKNVTLDEALRYKLPYADGYKGFWEKPLTMQHPLAKVEIVPWDNSLTLIFSDDKEIIDSFRAFYPKSKDLAEYIDGI